MQTGLRARLWVVLALASAGCVSASRPDLPLEGPFAPDHAVAEGVATGEVTADSALVWTRTKGPARVQVEWWPEAKSGAGRPQRSRVLTTAAERDFTIAIPLEGLTPATSYRYRLLTAGLPGKAGAAKDDWAERATGRFRTPASANTSEPVRFLWSGDLGGQTHCRDRTAGYQIFDRMSRTEPAFAILLGDLIYGDERCPSPPNLPGSDFVASTPDEFRAKHRYQRGDPALRRFLAEVPVYAIWDDHEVRNNFAGPHEPLMPFGRQALLEYWPIATPAEDPHRLYRKVRRGSDVELFILDTRQYRSKNEEPDGEPKTMLGVVQRGWLIEGLADSTATWKFIATSVPLSLPKKGGPKAPGNDSWAGAPDGTGFQTELRLIVDAIMKRGVTNVVWLAGDVHFAQVNEYDPDGDGSPDFREFVAGPLSAAPAPAVAPAPALGPRTLYSVGGFTNFGVVKVRGKALRLEIVDETGTPQFVHVFEGK
jgi:alkaline phosphatase D